MGGRLAGCFQGDEWPRQVESTSRSSALNREDYAFVDLQDVDLQDFRQTRDPSRVLLYFVYFGN